MANTIRPSEFLGTYLHILEETFAGPPRPGQGNAYLDERTGWLQTLAGLSAERASRPVAPGATSVAAQVRHTLCYLEVLEAFLRGGRPNLDWPGSWRPGEVTADAWDALRDDLMTAYRRVAELLRATERWDDDRLGDALAILVHSAYHLGAVRQMLRFV